ncbi:RNA polymerase sigma factor [Planotetraspora kaengkrachanensis]|uniref:DNA-directed RNA polymerase sigma-70 factor n=1 Tax=Planotetraspora kaengkrachanensis TaxID=575193 RepID=A0A8J3M1W0_9ACTN|nr:sigma-70 family RNA polymerase sigma factor [Planotetraspora kaengkrachanensis]GIG80840.1 DNA-directed RNA polymerase sigma-70 factor [Planotetraspora kaengkrachanensis]
MSSSAESDVDLVRAAQDGDATCLGLLVSRHQAGMRAVALSMLGYGPDAEDAVQDAMLTAVRRIGDLRDPAAAGPWLRAIVRNECRMRLRRSSAMPFGDLEALAPPSSEPTPEELLEHRSLRDWVWHAVGELSEPVRMVALLRYFSDVSSYEQIAALCGVPIGTVRSRLSQARTKLADALRDTADRAHDDAASFAAARRQEAEEMMAQAQKGEFAGVVEEHWWPDAEFVAPGGHLLGRDRYVAVRAMERDLSFGVRQRLTDVVAGRDLTIWEADLISPPDDPAHCPPGVVWLQVLREGRVKQLRLFHPRPAMEAAG